MKFKSIEEKVKAYLGRIEKENSRINAVLSTNPLVLDEAKKLDEKIRAGGKKGRLYGFIFGIKSNICVKGLECNCASKTMDGWLASYDADVIEKIKREDGVIIGMLNMDEFACGSSGETSAFGECQNPVAFGKIPGGSSSGSAASVAAGFCDVALGSDTGGSIRNPASHCGVVGVKPSYGLVSRYGLIDLSMSLDQIGPLGKSVHDCYKVLEVISGEDERDSSMESYGEIKREDRKKIKAGILKFSGTDKKIKDIFDKNISYVKDNLGWDIEEVDIEHINLAVQTYYLLVYSEFFSATRRFDGRKYGKKIEENCGEEVLRRILGGSEITREEFSGEYYQKALVVKELIRKEFDSVFKRFDCILSPTVNMLPWDIGKGKEMTAEEIYSADSLTIPANLAECCGISIPMGSIDNIPTGMQVLCAKGKDGLLWGISKKLEEFLNNSGNN